MLTRGFIFVLIINLMTLIRINEAIVCYQCGDTTDSGPCKNDIGKLETAFQDYHNNESTDVIKQHYDVLKNCTGWGDKCVIQEAIKLGVTVAFIRDCSNGRTFAFSGVNNGLSIVSDNQTTYRFTNEILSKITLCEGDLCNGPNPQIINITSVSTKKPKDLVCYGCSNINDDACQTDIQGLENLYTQYHSTNDTKNFLKKHKNLYNCTGRGDMCMIQEVKERGELLYYFRDCSDGLKFPGGDPIQRVVSSNNKSKCSFSTTPGQTVCITLCKEELCNGPNPSQASSLQDNLYIVFLTIVTCSLYLR